MKKIAIYGLLFAGITLTSCDEVEKMTGVAQENPEIPGYDITQLKVSSPVGEAVNLPALNAAKVSDVAVIEVESPGNLPEGYHLQAVYEVATAEDFSNPYTIDINFPEEEATGYITTRDLEQAYEAMIGLQTDPEQIYARAELYATSGKGTVVRLGGEDAYYASATFTLTPDPAFTLYTPGESNGWDFEKSMQLSSTDGSYYSGLAYLSGSFKFTSAPNWDGTNYGATNVEGKLSIDGEAANLQVGEPGLYWVTVNTKELTYTLYSITSLGIVGDFNGWGNDAEMTHNDDFSVWTGEVTFGGAGDWKIRANGDWKVSFGTSLEDMVQGGENLPDPGAGTYIVTFDASKLPYTATCVLK